MNESQAKRVTFDSIEDLFGIPKESYEHAVSMIPLRDLYQYSNHPFRVIDDTKMDELVDSIKENGVLEPAIVRPRALGGYEIISGHRRKRACEKAGIPSMPVIIKELNDDEAAIIMVDSNNQREQLLYSEKAWAYRIKYESMKHQGLKTKMETADEIGKEIGESGRQIKRYIRLTYLIKELLDLVDAKKIRFIVAERLSYLTQEDQQMLLDMITGFFVYPTLEAAEKMKIMSSNGELSEEKMEEILLNKKNIVTGLTISRKTIEKYFPKDYSKNDIEKVIIELLEKWDRGK